MPELGGQAPVERREPVAQDLTITTNEDTPVILKVLANDRDADGDLLSVVSVVLPRHGTVRINPDNTVTYTPESQFSGTDTFAYTIGDGRDGTDTGTVTVTVLPVQRRLATPSRSTTIALTSDDQRVVAVNRERHSLAIIEVRDTKSADTANLLAEVAVGNEPRFVALNPDDQEAYVTNALGGMVSVVALSGPVGTFDATDPLEQRGQGALSGQLALGGLGFNAPSLLGVGYHTPYLHHGEAQPLGEVFPLHALGTGTIATMLTVQQQADVIVFLNAIDGTTDPLCSAADDFRDALALP